MPGITDFISSSPSFQTPAGGGTSLESSATSVSEATQSVRNFVDVATGNFNVGSNSTLSTILIAVGVVFAVKIFMKK